MAKTEKSKAELYRQERKDRISSAAKKNAKKSRKHPGAGKIIGRVFGIVLAIAIVGGVAYGILDSTGTIARAQTAFKVGEHKISVAEYGYMYYMQYQNTANQAQQSESQYGYNMYGFDYNKSPEDQETTDSDGKTIKWSEKLEDNTIEYMQEFYAIYDNAMAEGYTVNDDEKADIEEQLDSMRATAAGDGSSQNQISMSLNSWLKVYYGKGITENFLRNLMEKEMVVQRYSEDKQTSFEDKYTNEVLDKEYKEDTTEYDVVDLRIYSFEPKELTAKDGESEEALAKRQDAENAKALEKANALLAEVTDEASFLKAAEPYIHEKEQEEAEASSTDTAVDAEVKTEEPAEETADDAADTADETADTAETADAAEEEHNHDSNTKAYATSKSSLTSSISEDAAKWAFAAKAGAKKAFAAENGTAYAMYVVKGHYAAECVDVRHILFMTVDSSTSEKLSDEEIAEKVAKKDEALAKWEASDKTEDTFAELATEYTEDTGSSSTGGLYERVNKGQMVDAFDQWIFDDSRKEGDYDVIESEYGYHIMYYVGNRDLSYRGTLRTSHTQEDYSAWLEDELAKDSVKVTRNESGMAQGYSRAYKLIDATVESINAKSNSIG